MKRLSIFLIIVLSVIFSCRKDPAIVPINSTIDSNNLECEPLAQDTGFGNTIYTSDPIKPTYPVFNPNDSYEIMYVSQSNNPISFKLIKYNVLDGTSSTVFNHSGEVLSMDWHKNDWIIFGHDDYGVYNVYKIKSNGDSLTQLTFSTNSNEKYLSPQWNYSGDKFICYKVPDYKSYIFNNTGSSILDSLNFTWNINCNWGGHPSDFMLSNQGYYIDLYDYNNDIFSSYEPEYATSGGAIFWINETEFVYARVENGIFKNDINLNSEEKLTSNCPNDLYLNGDINSNKTRMIWSKAKLTKTGNFKVNIHHYFVLTTLNFNSIITLEDLPL